MSTSPSSVSVDPFDSPAQEARPKLVVPDGIHFMHPWLEVWKSQKGHPKSARCSVAYRHVVDSHWDSHWEAGFAFCSPKDQFVKFKGRELALASLKDQPVTFRVPRGMDERDAVLRLIDSLPIRDDASGWMAQSWQTVVSRRFMW